MMAARIHSVIHQCDCLSVLSQRQNIRGTALNIGKERPFEQRELKRKMKVDRGVGGIIDGYTDDETLKVMDYFLINGAKHIYGNG
ncbi:predicted protein [Lichtheimia corymbifera JMRC:FSU:9682]|uniref:Uncharacterized protein n=1 Tax=Lichtheimia corymbifera JMRC:FSU:9682 TaxID=1263082 RepID=A0A068SI19_9FUNG|nr:predicted protein [Lichtheimia corymbifera JMRC:FSU:9682]